MNRPARTMLTLAQRALGTDDAGHEAVPDAGVLVEYEVVDPPVRKVS